MKKLHLIITTLMFSAICTLWSEKCKAQRVNSTASQTTGKHIIKSSYNNKAYELNVLLPKKYSAKDTTHYPVLYILDGRFSFNSMGSIMEVLGLGKEIKEIILVSIDDTCSTEAGWIVSRFYDFTPSSLLQADTLWSKIMNIPEGKMKSGGAELFLNTLEKELIPFINDHYKTNHDRGISGHSLSGLFAGYCLLKKPGLFTKYGINSPSFWWNNSEMVRYEKNYASQHTELAAKIFFSVGGAEDPMMVTPFNAFVNSIKSRNYKGFSMIVKTFEEETHLSVVPAGSSRMLKVLYGSNVN